MDPAGSRTCAGGPYAAVDGLGLRAGREDSDRAGVGVGSPHLLARLLGDTPMRKFPVLTTAVTQP
jgi:hypothetical protein